MATKVLLIWATGAFGARIAARLAALADHDIHAELNITT